MSASIQNKIHSDYMQHTERMLQILRENVEMLRDKELFYRMGEAGTIKHIDSVRFNLMERLLSFWYEKPQSVGAS